MAQPILQSNQPGGAGAGVAGEGRNDLEIGLQVLLTDQNPANSGATYFWQFEDVPVGSALVGLTGDATSTPAFIPDVTGSYRVNCTVNGLDTAVEIYAVPLAETGGRIPSFQETIGYDANANAKGWHEALTGFMRSADAGIGTGGAPSGAAGGELGGTYPNPTVNDGADATAIHDDTAGEIAAVTEKGAPVAGDLLLVEDSADSNNKKRVQVGNLPSGAPSGAAGGELGGTYPNPTVNDGADATAIHDDTAGEIAAVTEKGSPVSADLVLIEDSADSNNKKRVQVGNLPGGFDPSSIDQSLLPDTTTVYDIGSPSLEWLNLYVRNINILNGDITSDNSKITYAVDGASDFHLFNVGGTLVASFSQSLAILNADTVPNSDGGSDLGSASFRWSKARLTTGLEFGEASSAPTPAADRVEIYGIDNGGTTELRAAFNGSDHLIIDESGNSDIASTDAAAIHDDTAGEIAAVTEKGTPVSADLLLIEDSADSNNKKRVQVGNLPGGSGAGISGNNDYITKTMSVAQTSVANDTAIAFDTVESQKGALGSSGNQFTSLRAGHTYVLRAQLRITTGTFIIGRWYDVTGAAYLPGEMIAYQTTTADETSSLMIIFEPSADSTVEFRAEQTSGSPTVDSLGAIASIFEVNSGRAGVSGSVEFIDRIEVGSNVASVTFGTGGDGVFGRALDGDEDEEYILSYYLPGLGIITVDVYLRPNAATGTFEGARHVGGTSHSSSAVTEIYLVNGQGQNEIVAGERVIHAKTGKRRLFQGKTVRTNSAGGNDFVVEHAAVWTDTTTPITSLQILSTPGANIKAGARFVLWRRSSRNLRSDSAAVYERMSMDTVDPNDIVTSERTVGHTVFGGSVVGVSARVEDAVTAGSITCNVKVDGVTALSAVLDTTNSTSHVVREAIGVHGFEPDKNVSVEFVPSGYDNAGNVPSPVTVQVHLVNNGLVTQNDRVVAKTVLGADATTLSLTGLNGDLDEVYEVEGRLFLTLSAGNLTAQPNGLGTNLGSEISDSGVVSDHTDWRVLTHGAVTGVHQYDFKMILYANKSLNGSARQRKYHFQGIDHGDAFQDLIAGGGVWRETATNLASLDFVHSVASGILMGSEIVVRRIKA